MSLLIAIVLFVGSLVFSYWLYNQHRFVGAGVKVGFGLYYLLLAAMMVIVLLGLLASGNPQMMFTGVVMTIIIGLWLVVFNPMNIATKIIELFEEAG